MSIWLTYKDTRTQQTLQITLDRLLAKVTPRTGLGAYHGDINIGQLQRHRDRGGARIYVRNVSVRHGPKEAIAGRNFPFVDANSYPQGDNNG